MEIWKKINGYDNYEISNYGNVKNIKTNLILKKRISKLGYVKYALCKNGKYKYLLSHRLVAKHFILNNENKPEVNHKDLNKENNYVGNLEWSTKSENIIHSYQKGRNKKRKKIIREDGVIYETILIASIENKVSPTAISNCLSGKSKKSNGYVFKYFKE